MKKWILFFDGACHLCSREIEHYKKLKSADQIEFIDIADSNFSAEKYNLDCKALKREIHVLSPTGEAYIGIDAFIKIWTILPKYQKLAFFAEHSAVKPVLKVGYFIFAKIRPHLPKRKTTCQACVKRP